MGLQGSKRHKVARKVKQRKQKMEEISSVYEEKSILILSDDCLFLIFEYLEIQDVVAAEGVCMKFKTVAEMLYPTYKILNFDKILSSDRANCNLVQFMSQMKRIIHRVGPYITTLQHTKRPLKYSGPCYTGFMDIDESYIPQEITKHSFPAVIVADLESCMQITDENLLSMFKMDKIQVLALNSRGIKGTFLEILKNIIEIHLKFCQNLDWKLFNTFCEENPQLKRLCINITVDDGSGYDTFNVTCLQAIASNLINLESLNLIGYTTEGVISREIQLLLADLPKITKVDIGELDCDMNVFLMKIFEKNRLEYLGISYTKMSKIVDAVAKLTHLRVLKMNLLGVADSQASSTILERISFGSALQELHIRHCNCSDLQVKEFILRHPSIKFIDMTGCYPLYGNLFHQINHLVKQRRQTLKIVVAHTNLSHNLKDIYNGKNYTLKLIFNDLS